MRLAAYRSGDIFPLTHPDAPQVQETEEPQELFVQRFLEVREGNTLGSLLEQVGLDRALVYEAMAALREVFDPRNLMPGLVLTLTIGAGLDGTTLLTELVFDPAPGERVIVIREEESFTATLVREPLTQTVIARQAVTRTSLYEAALEAGIPVSLLVEVVRAFSYDVDFQRDLRSGDSFEILFERYTTRDGRPVREEHVHFAALTLGGTRQALFRYSAIRACIAALTLPPQPAHPSTPPVTG